MGLRFRKSVNLGKGTRLNLSKSGVGISTGVKGARVGVNSRGTRTTLSLPGTGISYVKYRSHGNSSKANQVHQSGNISNLPKGRYYSNTLIVLMLLASLVTSIASIPIGLFFLGLSLWTIKQSRTNTNKAYKIYNQALKTKNEQEKLELLKSAKEIDNNNDLVNYYLAYISFENKESKETLRYIEDIKEYKNINQQELQNIYIISLFENKNYKEVIAALESNIEFDLASKLIVALSYKELGHIKKASEILATGPVNKRTYTDEVLMFKYQLGLCYLELGEKDKAIRQLKKVYEVNSDFEEITKHAQELGFALGEHAK